jgi:hypothetical protein
MLYQHYHTVSEITATSALVAIPVCVVLAVFTAIGCSQ